MTEKQKRFWSILFWIAALFNFVIGVPLMLAREWAFALAFRTDVKTAGLAVDLWADFGFCVALIGVGYAIVAADVTRNRGIVWLGIFAKGFDVVVLTWRWVIGMTQPLVLVPAAIDAVFILFFVAFLLATRATTRP